MQEFLEANITAFIKKALAENDIGMKNLSAITELKALKNSCSAFMALPMRF